jgi:voltage-gated sodium channel
MEDMRKFLENPMTDRLVDLLLIINAFLLATLTFPQISQDTRILFEVLDKIILGIFVVELVLRLLCYGIPFFKNGWNLFDFIIITVSALSYSSGISSLRTLRVLRLFKIISKKSIFLRIISASIYSLKGIISIATLGLIVNFIFTIMACNLFGAAYPNLYGDLLKSSYSLMKLSLFFDWVGTAEAVKAQHSIKAFGFFITYFLLNSFVILNLCVAVVYDAYYVMNPPAEEKEEKQS